MANATIDLATPTEEVARSAYLTLARLWQAARDRAHARGEHLEALTYANRAADAAYHAHTIRPLY